MGSEIEKDQDKRTGGESGEAAPVVITPIQDGPLHVKGRLEIALGVAGDHVTETWLCRCGGSAKKPYCDGTHKRNGFKADGRAPVRK